MMQDDSANGVETNESQRGRTIIELRRHSDGEWIATQHDVSVSGRGQTAAKATLEYCRAIVEDVRDPDG